MGKKRISVSEEVRRAMNASGMSRYRISQITGIEESTLSRFVSRKTAPTIVTLEAVADVVGLEIVVASKRRRKGKV